MAQTKPKYQATTTKESTNTHLKVEANEKNYVPAQNSHGQDAVKV
jgi:hypothetical protein